MENGIWILLVGLVAAFIVAYIYLPAVRIITYLLLAAIVVVIFFKLFIKKYDETERAIIFRFGKFNRIGGPGWTLFIPFFEKEFQRIDIRTKTAELFVPVAFTSDDLRLKIDGVIYYRITDPSKALLKIDNYMIGLSDMMKSETRNLIASMSMRQVFSKLDDLNDILADKIRHATWQWGIDVPMVQLRGIMPPDEIAVAMQQKEIESQYMQAAKFKAEAKKIVMEAIGAGAKSMDDRAIMYLYIKALEEMSKGSATKIVLPMQFAGIMDKLGEGMGTGIGLGAGLDLQDAIKAVKEKISAEA
ncbi:MAG: SPFH domain-containing protein [Candidatus Nanoarchaeia archaeon]|nr:SPFH domain-containing protein [Candidatus Nanoarchaeia archaeon]MDD5239839.1 SPFH domain-containing protein [Candidatus Nanoarchaeia archaeon]